MKRLVLLVVALVFAMGTTVMAADKVAAPVKEEVKVEKAVDEKAAPKAKKAKKIKKAKKAPKAEEKKAEEAAPAAK